jgi:hypothetical protein
MNQSLYKIDSRDFTDELLRLFPTNSSANSNFENHYHQGQFDVFNTTLTPLTRQFISAQSHIKRVWTLKVSGLSTIRESQATKLLEGGFMNAQGATFNHVCGNQVNIYNLTMIVVLPVPPPSTIVLAMICGCIFLAFKYESYSFDVYFFHTH